MARTSSRLKLGFFPLDAELENGIRKRLIYPDQGFYALDPCCGAGKALNRITDGHSCRTFGIEIDRQRARDAERILDFVRQGDFETTGITGKCQLLFLNPPYEVEVSTKNRVEETFLEIGVECLAPGGVLILAVPLQVVGRLLPFLSEKFTDIRIVQGDETFRQVILFAVRGQVENRFAPSNLKSLERFSRGSWREVPSMEDGEWTYEIPRSRDGETFDFVTDEVDREAILEGLLKTGALKSLADTDLCPPPVEDRSLELIHPLTTGMVILLLQTGYFHGTIFAGDDRRCSVVKGGIVYCVVQREIESDKGKLVSDVEAPVTRIAIAHFDTRTFRDYYPDRTQVFQKPT